MNTSIYIPFVHKSITEDKITDTFNKQMIGNISKIHFKKRMLLVKGRMQTHNSAIVYLNYWHNNIASKNIYEKIVKGEPAKIVYDDPYFWYIYKNKYHNDTTTTEEKLENAFNIIKDLHERIIVLENTAQCHQNNYNLTFIPPPPVLKRSFNIN